MKPLPVRLRLTCWYFIMFAAAGILLGFISWWMLRHTLDATIRQDLQERVDDIRLQLAQVEPQADLREVQQRFRTIYQERDDGKWLLILDQEGQTLFRSDRLTPFKHRLNLPWQIAPAGALIDLQLDTHSVRFYCVPALVAGRSFRIYTGISMTKPHALLRRFGFDLLLFIPIVVVLSAIGGHMLSRKALAPVGSIAREVRRITDKNLSNRLTIPAGDDELSHLSITLNHMLARIDSGFHEIREFTANASHELRTPLARLRAEVEIALLRTRSASEYRQALERVHQDALDMSGLIENLLTLARAEAGNDTVPLSAVDLRSLIEDSAKEWEPIARRLNIHLAIEAPRREIPAVALGHRLSLLRLVRIWMDNACKFTPAGGTITLSAAEEGDDLVLMVEDTGIGIAAEHQVRIFERFYRATADSPRPGGGAGLGLSLATWIAKQHHTRIALESGLARGSRFSMKLQTAAADRHHHQRDHRSCSLTN